MRLLYLLFIVLVGCASTSTNERVRVLNSEIEALQEEQKEVVRVEVAFKDLVTNIGDLESKHKSGLDLPFTKSTLVGWYEEMKTYSSRLSDLIREKEKERNRLLHDSMVSQ